MTDLPTTPHACRHAVPAIGGDYKGKERLLAFVGWDRPLATFFLQVGVPLEGESDEIDGERMVHWVGTEWAEIPSVEKLVEAAFNGRGDKHVGTPWAQVDSGVVEHLRKYQALTPPGRKPAAMDWLGR